MKITIYEIDIMHDRYRYALSKEKAREFLKKHYSIYDDSRIDSLMEKTVREISYDIIE